MSVEKQTIKLKKESVHIIIKIDPYEIITHNSFTKILYIVIFIYPL